MKWLAWLSPAIVCLSALASPKVEWSDSGITGPSYKQQLALLDRLKSEYPNLVTVIEYGKSGQGRPLKLLVVKRPGKTSERPTIFMSGSTHGGEYLNIEDRLPEEVLRRVQQHRGDFSNFLEAGGAFVFVPIVNPDGYETHSRLNADGIDLNRDFDVRSASFKGFRAVESRKLAEKLEALRLGPEALDYKITVDYHCCVGAVLHPWSYRRGALPLPDDERHAAIEGIARRTLQIDAGSTGDILGYFPRGTTKDYFYEKYGAMAFTYEGRTHREAGLFPQHVQWWEGMAAHLLRTPPRAFLSLFPKRTKSLFQIAE